MIESKRLLTAGKSSPYWKAGSRQLWFGVLAALLMVGAAAVLLAAQTSRAGEQNRLYMMAKAASGMSWLDAVTGLRRRMDPAMLQIADRFDQVRPPQLDTLGPPIAEIESPDPSVVQAFASLKPEEAFRINAALPISGAPNPPARPFSIVNAPEEDHLRALHCLTEAVYYEAGYEPRSGRKAVAQVVLNRLRHPAYPRTVCGVVFQGSDRITGCQFTFTCDGSRSRAPVTEAWREAEEIADEALKGSVMAEVGNSTHYHTQWVYPYWAPTLLKVRQIGAHIFYRWSGGWGLPAAFRLSYAGGEASVGDKRIGFSGPAKGGPAGLIQASAPLPAAVVDRERVSVAEAGKTAEVDAAQVEAVPATAARVAINPVADLANVPTLVAPAIEAPRRRSRLAVPSGW